MQLLVTAQHSLPRPLFVVVVGMALRAEQTDSSWSWLSSVNLSKRSCHYHMIRRMYSSTVRDTQLYQNICV